MKYMIQIACSLLLLLIGACRNHVQNPRSMNTTSALRQQAIDEIRETDQQFSMLAEKQGIPKAFTTYAATEAIKLNDGAAPTVGFDSLRAQMARLPRSRDKLSWQPLKVDAALSGDMGYSFGQWMLTSPQAGGKTSLRYGVYVTVWKRQRNGEWRFVVDGGNQTPAPQ